MQIRRLMYEFGMDDHLHLGIGAFLSSFTSSVVPARVIPTPTFTPDPDVFASVIPITTVVVEAGAVYIPTVVTPTFAFVFNLNVFAIL